MNILNRSLSYITHHASRMLNHLTPRRASSTDAPPAVSPAVIVNRLNLKRQSSVAKRWRDYYNPLRELNPTRASHLLEAYQRGDMADLQWTYFFIEGADPDLFALVERRTSALLEMGWEIRLTEKSGVNRSPTTEIGVSTTDNALALEQLAALREAYENIDNLYESIDHLALATFRGFAHLEKHRDLAGQVHHLELLDQWNVVREGLSGKWKYNPDAKSVSFRGLSDDLLLDPRQWIIREVKRHVNRIGLMKFVRASMASRDWDAFLEIYGLPGVVVIGPPNATPEQEAVYESRATAMAEGGNGYLPNGAAVQFFTGPRLASPFGDYLRYLTEQLILAGTGGVLTMLATSGTGTLAGSVHAKTFEQIARAEARKISELFQKQLDAPVLNAAFPGQPHLAFFTLVPSQPAHVGSPVEDALKLHQAGYALDPRQLSEKTGYQVERLQIEDH